VVNAIKSEQRDRQTKEGFGPLGLTLIIICAVLFIVFCGWLSIRLNILGYTPKNSDSYVFTERSGPYYERLDSREKVIYKAVVSAAEQLLGRTEILETGLAESEFENVMLAIRYDEAALFYLDTFGCSAETSEKNSVVKLKYKTDGQTADKMTGELKAAAQELIGDLGNDLTDVEYILAIHDRLIASCEKADTKKQSKFVSTVYGAVVEKKADAVGYAFAMRYLLGSVGLQCTVVFGEAEGQSHAWNAVRAEGEFYYTDVYFDDPDSSTNPALPIHAFFMTSGGEAEAEALPGRTLDPDSFSFESSGKYDYYSDKGYRVTKADSLKGIINNAVNETDKENRSFIEIAVPEDTDPNLLVETVISVIKTHNRDTVAFVSKLLPEARVFSNGRDGYYTIQLFR
jgi:hypothetical protein